jgi:hypothetical protein
VTSVSGKQVIIVLCCCCMQDADVFAWAAEAYMNLTPWWVAAQHALAHASEHARMVCHATACDLKFVLACGTWGAAPPLRGDSLHGNSCCRYMSCRRGLLLHYVSWSEVCSSARILRCCCYCCFFFCRDYYAEDGSLRPTAATAEALLLQALKLKPHHLHALHLHIHSEWR